MGGCIRNPWVHKTSLDNHDRNYWCWTSARSTVQESLLQAAHALGTTCRNIGFGLHAGSGNEPYRDSTQYPRLDEGSQIEGQLEKWVLPAFGVLFVAKESCRKTSLWTAFYVSRLRTKAVIRVGTVFFGQDCMSFIFYTVSRIALSNGGK